MTTERRQGELFGAASDETGGGVVVINDRCRVRTQAANRIVEVTGSRIRLAQYAVGDAVAEAYAMVSLVEQGWARQKEVGRAFGCTTRTIRRYQRRYERGGLAALEPRKPSRSRSRAQRSRDQRVLQMKHDGLSNRETGRRIGISEKTVRNVLRRVGWVERAAEQLTLGLGVSGAAPEESASRGEVPDEPEDDPPAGAEACGSAPGDSEPPPFSLDDDPSDRSMDRALAMLGLLNDAAPLFDNARDIPNAAVLLAVPALVGSGLLETSRRIYGCVGPAFYGLRTAMVTLVFMALLRIKSAESLKERDPCAFGRALGLDRAPEVKTMRRKLAQLAEAGRAKELGRALAEHRAAGRGTALGFLYVDGHVRVYHGARTIPKGHVGRLGRPKPATTDYWCNDALGEPLFVVPSEAHKSLVKMLPEVLAEARSLLGERRTTVVFDRGGWSPKLFRQLISAGFDIITYRKGRARLVPKRLFVKQEAIIDGRVVSYRLADRGVLLLRRKLRLRQVTILREDGCQTHIITSRRDLPAIEVAHRMVARWKQENFFKYLRAEFALDALVDYEVEAADPRREVPNPKRQELDAQLRAAWGELEILQARYGLEAFDNPEQQRRTMRGFKTANASLAQEIETAMKLVLDLERRRAKTPERLPVGKVVDEPVIKLAVERKLLTDLLKMVAYQIEGELLRHVSPHYSRSEQEGRTLVQTILTSAADIEVSDGELRVRVAPLSSPHKTQALAILCSELTATNTVFPGTRLRLCFAVHIAPEGTLAFPGPRPPTTPPSGEKADISLSG